jgi:hypothetical protein
VDNPGKVNELRARWAVIRPYLFKVVVRYNVTFISDTALEVVSSMENVLDLTEMPLADPQSDPKGFDRDVADRREERRKILVSSHLLLKAIRQYHQDRIEAISLRK